MVTICVVQAVPYDVPTGRIQVIGKCLIWRRERDSNPRRAFDPYTLSRDVFSSKLVYPYLIKHGIYRLFCDTCLYLSRGVVPYHAVRGLYTLA